jgi:L-lactate dehydrogenase complex protein LldG
VAGGATPPGGRDAVLARVRRALGRAGEPPAPEAVTGRLQRPTPNTVPARGRLPRDERLALFVRMALASQATLDRVPDREALPRAVAAHLEDAQLPKRVVLPPASPLSDLPWSEADVAVERRLVRSGDPVALATAAAGIAETGTLALLSGPGNPVTGNFLPEHQLVVVDADDVLAAPEDFWARLRAEDPEGRARLPRTVNWIAGPSRSGDIEMTMLMGAHGPVAVHVLLVG